MIDDDAAGGIDGSERADDVAVRRPRRGRPNTALVIDRRGARAGADAAQAKIGPGRSGRGVAKLAVGRETPPILVAGAEEVEQYRRRHDRHARGSDRKAAAAFLEPRLHAGSRI